jgi:hypothetical protein
MSALPEKGWQGYGAPGHKFNKPELQEAAARIRSAALDYDRNAERLLEAGFVLWCHGTVYPQAINRRIAELCRG